MDKELRSKMRRRGAVKLVLAVVLAVVAVIVVCDVAVTVNSRGRIYDDVNEIPEREYGLVLGTSPFWGNHNRNFYFENRISAAADLYHAGKVKRLIVSGGDYREKGDYDEPTAMRDSLVAHGVPSDVIIMDFDGIRTLNSLVKAKKVYGLDSLTIVSQEYHNERAIYQTDNIGLDAIAYNAVTPRKVWKRVRNRGRECLARVKLFLEVARGVSW